MAETCDRLSLYRVLLDERKLSYTVGEMTDLMSIGDSMVETFLVFRFHRIACVTTPEQVRIIKDFEAVARNRGLNWRAFSDFAEADAWLTES